MEDFAFDRLGIKSIKTCSDDFICYFYTIEAYFIPHNSKLLL